MKAINIKAYTDDPSQIEAIIAMFKAFKVKYKISKEETPYNPEFVDKILKGDEDLKAGKGKKVTLDEFKELCK